MVSLDALPDDENDILQILQAEQAPLRLWIEFANAYLACGKKEQCQRVLEDGCHSGEQIFVLHFQIYVVHYPFNFTAATQILRCTTKTHHTSGSAYFALLPHFIPGRRAYLFCALVDVRMKMFVTNNLCGFQGRLERVIQKRDDYYSKASGFIAKARPSPFK